MGNMLAKRIAQINNYMPMNLDVKLITVTDLTRIPPTSSTLNISL